MKVFLIIYFLISVQSFGQLITLEEWNKEAETNIRLLPKYGLVTKTPEQKAADNNLIADMTSKGLTRRQASNQFIEVGFQYLYKDIKIAMYRFNQAYLLDSTNVDIYWGYGGVYAALGDLSRSKQQYQIGLSKEQNNTRILTDLATCYLSEFYSLNESQPQLAKNKLDTAVTLFTKSYQFDKTNQNTLFKLSVCYYNKQDCDNAQRYYKECLRLGGAPITEEYKKSIIKACGKK